MTSATFSPRLLVTACVVTLFASSVVHAQATRPAATQGADPTIDDLTRLRDALKDAYNRGDVDKMLTYLHPDVLIIFPDGEVLIGRDALRGYYDKMLKGPSPVVRRYTAEPIVDGRQFRGDVDLSWGRMNDQYELTNGMEFGLDSRFTTTLLKMPDGPPESAGWVIRSFHSSTDAFDNPILATVARRSLLYGGIGGLLLGAIVGVGIALLIRRRRVGSEGLRTG